MDAAETLPVAEEFRRLSLDLLASSVIAFFEGHQVAVTRMDEAIETDRRIELPLGSMIGFVSDHARGTLALSPTEALLMASHPTGDREQEEGLEDWVGEMANQVLGRLKNQLLPHGIELLGDTPMAVSGRARIGGIRRPATRVRFGSEHGCLTLWWDVQVDDDMVIGSGGEAAHAEGDMMLF